MMGALGSRSKDDPAGNGSDKTLLTIEGDAAGVMSVMLPVVNSCGRSFTSTVCPGAMTVIQLHKFSNCLTLPGKSSLDKNCMAASDKRFTSTPS